MKKVNTVIIDTYEGEYIVVKGRLPYRLPEFDGRVITLTSDKQVSELRKYLKSDEAKFLLSRILEFGKEGWEALEILSCNL